MSVRVLHVITDLDVGGAEVTVARLAAARRASTCAVVSLKTPGPVAEHLRADGIPVIGLGMRPGRPDARAWWRLVRLIRRYRPDVVQTWLYHADLMGIAAGAATRVPVVWNVRCAELDPRDHPRSLRVLIRLLALASRWPAAVVSNSNAGRDAHIRLGYRPRQWALIPNGFDVSALRPSALDRDAVRAELDLERAAPLIGMIGRVHAMKDHDTFLRAAAIVAERCRRARFVVAGRGVGAPAFTRMVADRQFGGQLRLLDEVARPARLMAALDLFVSSSYSEAFPNVVAEAMACAVPCVVTDVGDSAAIVGDTGKVVPPRNPQALADGIMELLSMDAGARAQLGAAARERIATRYSLSRAAEQYEALYRDIAETGAGRAR